MLYQETLTDIFKQHESFDAAAEEIRSLGNQQTLWKHCLDDGTCTGSIIKYACKHYAASEAFANQIEDEFDPIAFTVANALTLDTPGAYAWCKKKCAKDESYITPIHHYLTALCGDAKPNIPTITKLLDLNVLGLNEISDNGGPYQHQVPSPLSAAATCGHHELVALLIARGAKVDKPCPVFFSTPLMLACINGHVECVRTLISAKADLNIKHTMNTLTALAFAKTSAGSERHDAIIKLLKDAGAQE